MASLQLIWIFLSNVFSIIATTSFTACIKLMGAFNGAYVSAGTSVTGGAKGDLSGYTIELTAEEDDYAPFLSSGAKTALYAAVKDEYVS